MQPPFPRELIHFGEFIAVRWYAICILSGAFLGGWLGSHRIRQRGRSPQIVWDWLIVGIVLGVAGARTWYIASSWPQFQDPSFWTMVGKMVNTTKGGLAIHGAIVGASITVLLASWRLKMNTLDMLDVLAPCLSVGQAVGRWGNFFNQEAYGGPVDNGLPWNLDIDAQYRLSGTQQYPPETRFHPTFLYESLWNLGVLFAIIWIERRFRNKLRKGDSLLIYGVLYSIGRFWIEDLRVDKLCTGGIGGIDCANEGLSTARLVSVILIVGCSALFVGRRLIRRNPGPAAYVDLDHPWEADEEAPATAKVTL